ncbi:MAG: hypothetical protein HY664_04840 [Chloroflexi bacterium]|nr:hypothetical protein [Chloroflexota bacterium]
MRKLSLAIVGLTLLLLGTMALLLVSRPWEQGASSKETHGDFQIPKELTFVTTGIENQFPEGMVFTAEVAGPEEIEEIAMHYSLKDGSRSAYGYLDFEPSKKVVGTYYLKTKGNYYLPPGVDITYYYVAKDKVGNEVQTEPRVITYLDNRFVWQGLEEGPVKIFWHDGPRSSAQSLLQSTMDTVKKMDDLVGGQLSPVKLYIYNSKPEIDVALPLQSQTSRRELITAGQTFADVGLILMLEFDGDTASHEITHLLVDNAVGHAVKVPDWLNEGLAVYAEKSPAREYTLALNEAIKNNTLLPLKGMSSRPGKPEDVILFYGQSHSLVRFLIENYGSAKMKELLGVFRGGSQEDEALLRVYGFDRSGLENEWRARLGLEPRSKLMAPALSAATGT